MAFGYRHVYVYNHARATYLVFHLSVCEKVGEKTKRKNGRTRAFGIDHAD